MTVPTSTRRRAPRRPFSSRGAAAAATTAALALAAVVALPTAPARGQKAPADKAAAARAAADKAQADREALMERQREQQRKQLQQQREQLQQQREQQFDAYKKMVSNMPKMDAKTLDDVMTFKMDAKHLSCNSPLIDPDNLRNGQYRLEVGPFKGPAYVQVVLSFNGAMFGGPFVAGGKARQPQRTFNLNAYDAPSAESLSTVNLQAAPGWLQIVRSTQLGNGNKSVQVVDSRDPEGRDGVAQLTVNEYGTANPAPRSFTLRAADFYTLLRDNPREAEEFVRPLLRDLGQESVFAPDVLVAWQVFSDTWKADERITDRIKGLLPDMASNEYRLREKAVAELEGMGRAGAAALLRLDRSGLSAQQNLAVDRALAPYAQLTPREAEQYGKDRAFLLDCLYTSDRAIRAAALARLRDVTGQDVAFDLDAAANDRSAAVTALRKRLLIGEGSPATRPTTGPSSRPAVKK